MNALKDAAVTKAAADQKDAVDKLWADTITYNTRWFAEQLVVFQAGLVTKVIKKALPPVHIKAIDDCINECLLIVYANLALVLDNSSELAFEKTSIGGAARKQPGQAQYEQTSRSSRRRQKRRQQKTEAGKSVGSHKFPGETGEPAIGEKRSEEDGPEEPSRQI